MAEKKWTTEQLQAITERGRDILVSAGAGSGKTAVMVERATRLILDERVPVSSMLIVTFTNAAASEMRERLRQALKERLASAVDGSSGAAGSGAGTTGGSSGAAGSGAADTSEQEWIRKQLDDLHGAQISTFHSFAQRVIREFFYLTDIEPGARVLDEAEDEVLKEEAVDELFDSEYEENRDDFRAFLDYYSGEKSDDDARGMIRSLYRKLEVIPDGLDKLDEKIGELELDAEGFKKTKAYEELLKQCRRDLTEALEIAERAKSILEDEGLTRMADIVGQEIAAIKEAAGSDNINEAVKSITFARMMPRKDEKPQYEFVKDIIKALRNDYKEKVNAVQKLYYADLDTMTKVMNMTVPFAKTLSRLVRRFDQLFRDIKNDHKGIDYSDMEHYAYEILGHKEAADYYRDLFRYIFIDEYQDTNYMQETIVSLIARPDNMFMVGDIKQSIYHFRLADPEIFQNKYEEYRKHEGDGSAIKIDLNQNFRSKEPVIREINKMFRPLMDGYDKDAELVCGVEQGEHALQEPKTYIVDRMPDTEPDDEVQGADMTVAAGKDVAAKAQAGVKNDEAQLPGDAELEDIKKEELEAREAVEIIRENLGKEFYDPKSGKTRKVDYRDIVILMRSFRRSAEGYRDVFREAGIPLYIDDRDGYFDTVEINVALSLLSIIDNKRQDVPLIALMRSEIFGFTCEELALIRKLHREGSYVEAVEAAAGITDQDGEVNGAAGAAGQAGQAGTSGGAAGDAVPEALRRKCRHVFDDIRKWQTYAVTLPLADMIWRILNETGYYVITGTFPGGAGRQANLRLLADRAREYSERSLGSLYGFIRYIDTLKKNQVEMPQATLFSENENVVRIMTIHHSKGLEFPVVILAGMDNQPKGDGGADIDFDREIGLGMRAKDPARHLREDSLVLRIIAAKEKQAETDELKRVFYVAVTRARETFYLLGAADFDRITAQLEAGQHSDSTLLRMSRYLPEVEHVSASELLAKPLPPEGKLPAQQDEEKPSEKLTDEMIAARLGFEYPYAAAAELAAKTTVTGLNQGKMRGAAITGPGDEGVSVYPNNVGIVPETGEYISAEEAEEAEIEAEDKADAKSAGTAAGPAVTERKPGSISEGIGDIVPDFMCEERKITAARIGTVYHIIMERLDFSRAGKEGFKYIAERTAELVRDGLFTEEEARKVDLGRISAFFDTDIGKRCVAAADASMLYKERTFESKITMRGENVLVQGVIDCWLEEQDGEVLLDYKTNWIDRNKNLDEEKERIRGMYRMQLDLYADAIEKATGRKVKEKYLYLFAIGEAITV